MATILDVGILEHFQIIFPFLLVFCISLVALAKVEAFQKNKALQAMVAVVLAFMTLFSKIAVSTILLMAPWFVMFFLVATFGYILARTIGYGDEHIVDTLTGKNYGKIFGYITFTIILLVFLGSLTYTFSQQEGFLQLTQQNGSSLGLEGESAGFFAVLVDPQVLGMVLIFIIAVVTILKMTESG